ncbi:threonine synthase [Mangrovibacterium lignilyticum]|uniref:threonine synthase n=1 Tax=Mangrovibacterium lignilyticum TaxID=2668052 RepID=UPI0013D1B814|nr:threonine synthase [Mangrovibacterium lignilyticum]
MQYYSTNKSVPEVSLKLAVTKGLADDKGLFMPERINQLPASFFETIEQLSFQEISFEVAKAFFGEDIPEADLKALVFDTLQFDCPIVPVHDNIYSLELFHGPTLAFKDVGGRFMARLLGYFLKGNKEHVNVLVATSGDTGSAVANGFLGVPGIDVYVLYPKGLVSEIQEKQFTTLGQNITSLEIDGTFDDCQRLVKSAFMDETLKSKLTLTSANSINVARFLPQAFYYFNAYARLKEKGLQDELVVAVPSGNFGNLTAGLFAQKMGLPIKRFIAANNENDIVYQYLQTGEYKPRPSVATIANAMDVGDPSNFARILDLFDNSHEAICSVMKGFRYSDAEIREVLLKVYTEKNYLLDPHGACAYKALAKDLGEGEVGVFLETAHPAKFTETVEQIIGKGNVPLPEKLAEFMKGEKLSVELSTSFDDFQKFLLETAK